MSAQPTTVPAGHGSPEPTIVSRPARFTRPVYADVRTHKGLRVLVFFFSWTFALVGFSAGIHAYVRSNNQKHWAQNHFPIPVDYIIVHTLDLVQAGTVLTVGMGGLFAASGFALLATYIRLPYYTLLSEAYTHLFWTIWILACSIGTIVVARREEAKAVVIVNGQRLPDDQVYPRLGLDRVYWHHGYVRFFAVVAFVTWFFSVIAVWCSFRSLKQSKKGNNEVKA